MENIFELAGVYLQGDFDAFNFSIPLFIPLLIVNRDEK